MPFRRSWRLSIVVCFAAALRFEAPLHVLSCCSRLQYFNSVIQHLPAHKVQASTAKPDENGFIDYRLRNGFDSNLSAGAINLPS